MRCPYFRGCLYVETNGLVSNRPLASVLYIINVLYCTPKTYRSNFIEYLCSHFRLSAIWYSSKPSSMASSFSLATSPCREEVAKSYHMENGNASGLVLSQTFQVKHNLVLQKGPCLGVLDYISAASKVIIKYPGNWQTHSVPSTTITSVLLLLCNLSKNNYTWNHKITEHACERVDVP